MLALSPLCYLFYQLDYSLTQVITEDIVAERQFEAVLRMQKYRKTFSVTINRHEGEEEQLTEEGEPAVQET